MSLTPITITGTFKRADGTPASGYVLTQLTEAITNGALQIDPVAMRGVLNAKGELQNESEAPFVLYANDDAATEPTGSHYEFTLQLDGQPPRKFFANVPHTAAEGKIDLTALEPKVAPGAGRIRVWARG